MLSKRSPLFWLRWGVLLVVLLWFWIAPRRTWSHFLTAIDNGSSEGIEATVDMNRFRDNLRIDLGAAVLNQPGEADTQTREATNKGMLTDLVSEASSPSGMQQLVATFGYTGAAAAAAGNAPDISFHYRSPLSLEVSMRAKGAPESETGLFTLQLTGRGWRLVRIRSHWLAGKQA